jgi:hypothetical protein
MRQVNRCPAEADRSWCGEANTATVRVSLVEHANDIGLHQRVEIYRVCCLDCSDAGLLMGGLRSNR